MILAAQAAATCRDALAGRIGVPEHGLSESQIELTMHLFLNTDPARRRIAPGFWLALVALIAGAALWWHGPIAQWASYHDFADARSWWAIPNAANVLSNLPFGVIGVWGFWRLGRSARNGVVGPAHAAWSLFSAAVAATAFGSAAYHWAPSNASLVTDRLPIAWACAALLCALIAERVDSRWGRPRMLASGLAVATASVLWWWFTERQGHGDLRAYLWVQFLPMLLVPLVLALRLPATGTRLVPASAWWMVLGLYGLAKVMELADATVFDTIGFASGHTFKHLLAAAAAWWLLRAATTPRRTADQLR